MLLATFLYVYFVIGIFRSPLPGILFYFIFYLFFLPGIFFIFFSPATCYPSPASRYPSPATRYPWKSPDGGQKLRPKRRHKLPPPPNPDWCRVNLAAPSTKENGMDATRSTSGLLSLPRLLSRTTPTRLLFPGGGHFLVTG